MIGDQTHRIARNLLTSDVAVDPVKLGLVRNDGVTPVADGFWRAGLLAIQSGHRRMVVQAGTYRSTEEVLIPSGIVLDWPPMTAVLVADWNRTGLEAAVTITDDGNSACSNGGRYTGITINAAQGTSGGVGLRVHATGAAGAHYSVISQLWVAGSGTYGVDVGEWDYPLYFDGTDNNTAADGIRFVTVEHAKLFFARNAYVNVASGRRVGTFLAGFYSPADTLGLASPAYDVDPISGLEGVVWDADTSSDCFALHTDLG